MAKTKKDMMRELRAARRARGLVPVTCHVSPEQKRKLVAYVELRLNGEVGA